MDTTDREERRDRAQMECWDRAVTGIAELYGWSTMKTAEHLLSKPHKIFEGFLVAYGKEWGKILMELGGAK